MRALLAALAACAALLAAPAAASATTAADCGPVDRKVTRTNARAAETAVRCLIDRERAARGLAPLRADRALRRAAGVHTADMIARRFFAHVSPGGGRVGDRVRGAGYPFARIGENIAAGQRTPRRVVAAWVRSAGHCRNVFGPQWRDQAVAVRPGRIAGVGRGPVWTSVLGLRAGAAPASGPAVACPAAPLPAATDVRTAVVTAPATGALPSVGPR